MLLDRLILTIHHSSILTHSTGDDSLLSHLICNACPCFEDGNSGGCDELSRTMSAALLPLNVDIDVALPNARETRTRYRENYS